MFIKTAKHCSSLPIVSPRRLYEGKQVLHAGPYLSSLYFSSPFPNDGVIIDCDEYTTYSRFVQEKRMKEYIQTIQKGA